MASIFKILSPGFIPTLSAGEFFNNSFTNNELFLYSTNAPIPPYSPVAAIRASSIPCSS